MRMKLLILILLIQAVCFPAQNTNSHSDPHKIVPPTQETFNLSKIDYSGSTSGEFSYRYPIIAKEFKLPISLSYTSGIKVNDIGGSVGLSWQLVSGGTISRIVKDETDENHINWKPDTVDQSSDLLKIREASYPANSIDTEYDWFNFSISNGLSGSFYIDENLNAYFAGSSEVKIFIQEGAESPYGKMLEFKIIDKEGNEYYFGGQDSNVEKTRYEFKGPDQRAVTGWYLHKIKYTDNTEVFLHYTLEELRYFTSLDASFNLSGTCPTESASMLYSDVAKTKASIYSSRPRVERIVQNDKEIKFNYTKARNDLFTNTTTNLLTSIQLKVQETVIDSYSLDYFDVASTAAAYYYNISHNETTTRHRHFLKSINQNFKNNKTQFEYDRLDLIPSRFSLNSDYFGYANGKNNASPFPKIGKENNFGIFLQYQNIVPISILSADKSVNPALSSVGNLSKITHPTKGFSEIKYEPNQSFETVEEKVRQHKVLTVHYNKCNLPTSTPSQSFSFESDGSFIEFEGNAFFDDYASCGAPDSLHDIHSLKIIDVSDNNAIVFTSTKKVTDPFIAINGTNNYPIFTHAGHTYKVEYSVSSKVGAVRGELSMSYNNITTVKQAYEYYGGSRVKEIMEYSKADESYKRIFYYSQLANIVQKKASVKNFNPSIILANNLQTSLLCQGATSTFPQVVIVDFLFASTHNLLNSFTNRNSRIFYSTVTEVIDNKSAIEKNYSYNDDLDGYIGKLPLILSMPKTNLYSEFRNGLLKEEIHYEYRNSKFDTIRQLKYDYNYLIERKNKSHVFRENFMYTPNPGEDPLINISYGSYENYYGSLSPTKIVDKELVNGKVLTKTTINNYVHSIHHQLTSQSTTFPDSTTHETNYSYAHEKGNTFLTGKNMVGIPLETEVKKNGVVISKSETKYPVSQDDADEKTSGLPLPVSVSNLDLQSNAMNMGVLYKKYDSRGNLLQYNLKPDVNGNSGNPVTIIWDYNQTQPIAKIEGAKLSDIPQGLITNIVNASDYSNPSYSESNLIDQLDAFRVGLPGYQISTYTYKPLIGVSSITPPSGIREIYIYDTANRLQAVKDVNGNVLKEYEYHYKP